MPFGSAKQVPCLRSLLSRSDFITLHVPETPATHKLISQTEFVMMKRGACLINDSRGFVVDISALIVALGTGHIAGAALDVFPNEPDSNGAGFDDTLNEWATKLEGMKNVMLTPHIGGSTEEAQVMIGEEADFMQSNNILGAVNGDEPSVRDRWRSGSRTTNGGGISNVLAKRGSGTRHPGCIRSWPQRSYDTETCVEQYH
uniref:D-isomer specific 2-hydroxyacid dehydrogenase NAD-binding domain-containing protein n=1 Tax=Moniliophthora roreri TaxID=221103 RepID=A0A0W0FRV8_MONRR